jgi:predicted dehydrogenase
MIKIAVIGTGGMAKAHAENFSNIRGCRLVAACDVEAERSRVFAEQHGIGRSFASLDALFDWGQFDAVTNVTPDRMHAPISLQALRAGKHVLCEKPLAVGYADAAKMAKAARKSGLINMVNFSYRNSAAIHAAKKLVDQGVIGRVMHADGHYFQSWLVQDGWGDWRQKPAFLWRLSTAHGSLGVLGDVGVHLLDFVSYPIGEMAAVNCTLKTFPKAPQDKIGEYVLDANDTALISVPFRNGALASLQTSRWATGHANSVAVTLFGDEGSIKVDLDRSSTELELCQVKKRVTGPWRTIKCAATPSIYQRFIRSIQKGANDQPDFARGAEIQKALDACMESHQKQRPIKL